jgi:hypothetical protein
MNPPTESPFYAVCDRLPFYARIQASMLCGRIAYCDPETGECVIEFKSDRAVREFVFPNHTIVKFWASGDSHTMEDF